MNDPQLVAVTGGGGFLGQALCRRLREKGLRVISLSRRRYPELAAGGIECREIDLAQGAEAVAAHLSGVSAVFHVAARVGMWGRYEEFYQGNVAATRNVIAACKRQSVPHLIFTSSPSVVADGTDLCGIDESYPYPRRHTAFYPATKMIAEQEVRAAGRAALGTVCLRPHLIWGPGDAHLVPTIVARARQGRLLRVGRGTNRTDITFIDDCVSAHIAAWQALQREPGLSGRVYFVSQGEPVNMWDWIDDILARHGLPKVRRALPVPVAMTVARVAEARSRLCGGEPLLTHFLVSEMSTSHYFSIAAARRDLGYVPRFSVAQAMDCTFGSR